MSRSIRTASSSQEGRQVEEREDGARDAHAAYRGKAAARPDQQEALRFVRSEEARLRDCSARRTSVGSPPTAESSSNSSPTATTISNCTPSNCSPRRPTTRCRACGRASLGGRRLLPARGLGKAEALGLRAEGAALRWAHQRTVVGASSMPENSRSGQEEGVASGTIRRDHQVPGQAKGDNVLRRVDGRRL